jgi:hypothetical protein
MSWSPSFALAAALVLAMPPAWPADAGFPCPLARPPGLDRAAAPIRSPADLADYLARDHGAHDPLAALSAPARARFVASLRFGPHGATAFQSEDLQAELTAAQAWRLLALFGLQAALAALPALPVETDDDAAVEAWRQEQGNSDLGYR